MDTGERFGFAFRMHAKLSRGGSHYVYVCEEFGIQCDRYRRTSADPWQRCFSATRPGLEGQTFPTLAACVAAMWADLAADPV